MMIDQRDLPAKFDIVPHTELSAVVHSIKIMLVRGAPAIGAAGAFGMALAAIASPAADAAALLKGHTMHRARPRTRSYEAAILHLLMALLLLLSPLQTSPPPSSSWMTLVRPP